MKALIVLIALFSLSLGDQTSKIVQPQSFPDIRRIAFRNFHSRVEYRDAKNIAAYVEEYYDFFNGRGRLDVVYNGASKSYYYDNATRPQIVEVNVAASTCIVRNNISNVDILSLSSKLHWNDDDNPSVAPMYGPSTLLRRRSRLQKANQTQNATYTGISTVRGITCDSWRVTEDLGFGGTLNFNYYFATKTWMKFENARIQIPVRIELVGPAGVDITQDYFMFEPFYSYYGEFLIPVGIGCDNRTSAKSIPTTRLNNQFRTVIESVDLLNPSLPIQKFQIAFDTVNQMLRLDSRNGTSMILIQDYGHGISYIFKNNEQCTMQTIQNLKFANNSLPTQLSTIPSLFKWDGSNYFMGKTLVRGIICNVFETVLKNTSFPLLSKQRYPRIVVTSYFMNDFAFDITAFDGVSEGNAPVQSLVSVYNSSNSLIIRKQFNFFSFDDLYLQNNYMDVFNVRDCYTDPTKRKYVQLFTSFPANDPDGAVIKENYKSFRHNIGQKLATIAKISPIRIPMVEVEFNNGGAFINTIILDKQPNLMSFRQQKNSVPQNTETLLPVTGDEDCASRTLRRGARSFHYCRKSNRCYVFPTAPKKNNGIKLPNLSCELWTVAGNLGILQKVVPLNTAIANLRKFTNSSFTFSYLDNNGNTQDYNFIFQWVHASSSAENDTQGNEMYVQGMQGFCLNGSIEFNEDATPSDGSMDSLGDCYEACQTTQNIQCTSFSYARKPDGTVTCVLSPKLVNETMNYKLKAQITYSASYCNIYIMNFLSKFKKVPGKLIKNLMPKGKPPLIAQNAEQCAQNCIFNSTGCESFQFCANHGCYMSPLHYIDLSKPQIVAKNKTQCIMYTVKYMRDYMDSGYDLVADSNAEVVHMGTVEGCSRICSSKDRNCRSFNFCPDPYNNANGQCELSTKSIRDKGAKVKRQETCRHYELKKYTKAPIQPQVPTQAQTGVSSGGFYGLIIGLFIVGLILGGVGYLGYQHYMKNRNTAGGLGLSVKFMKHTDEVTTS